MKKNGNNDQNKSSPECTLKYFSKGAVNNSIRSFLIIEQKTQNQKGVDYFISGETKHIKIIQIISILTPMKRKKGNDMLIEDIEFRVKKNIECHNYDILSLVVTNNKKYFISGSRREIFVWNVDSMSIVKELIGHESYIVDMDIVKGMGMGNNKNNGKLLSVSEDKTIRIWCLRKYKCIKIIDLNISGFLTCVLSFNNKIIAGSVGETNIWDMYTYEIIKNITNISGKFVDMRCILKYNNCLLLGQNSCNLVYIVDLKSLMNPDNINNENIEENSIPVFKNKKCGVYKMVLYKNNYLICSSNQTGKINIVSLKERKIICSLIEHSSWCVNCLIIKNNMLFSGGENGEIFVWNLSTILKHY